MKTKQLVMVLGMHRSGTSAVARALEVVGVDLGRDLLPPMANVNEKGFWEDRDFNRLNIEIHSALDKEWYDRFRISAADLEVLHRKGFFLNAVEFLRKKFDGVSIFGIKDPRATRLLPFWKSVAAHCGLDLSFIMAARNPLNVARSLGIRDKFDIERGYLLWLDYVLQGIADSQNCRRLVVDYDRLVDSPAIEIARMADSLGLEIDAARLDLYTAEFLEQRLRHNECGQRDLALDPRCPQMIREIHDTLIDAAVDKVSLDDSAVLERVVSWTSEYAKLDPLCNYIEALTQKISLGLSAQVESEGVIAALRETNRAQGEQISILGEASTKLEQRIADFIDEVARREGELQVTTEKLGELRDVVAARDAVIDELREVARRKQAQCDELVMKLAECGDEINRLVRTGSERDAEIGRLRGEISSRDEQIATLERTLADRDYRLSALSTSVRQYAESSSWRLSAPIRFVGRNVRRARLLASIMPDVLQRGGGVVGTARKSVAVMRREGIHGVRWRLRTLHATGHLTPTLATAAVGDAAEVDGDAGSYAHWIKLYDVLGEDDRQQILARIVAMRIRPRISVIMPVYNPPPAFLEKAIWSVRNQLYPDWELCISDDKSSDDAIREVLQKHAADDARIRVVFRTENGHISAASNSALGVASGEFIAMLDHDDEIPEHALYMVANEINSNPDVEFIYSDQDKIDENGVRFDPYFKPDFDPDLLRSQNFVDHLAVFRTESVRRLGGWRSAFDGSQDYDLVLRVTERVEPARIRHIPHVLYHWRALPGSLAIDPGAKNYAAERSRDALREHLSRLGVAAEVTSEYPNLSIHRVIYELSDEPLVSIIIPTKDGKDILSTCLDGIFNQTDYGNFEVIVVDNQSEKPETHEYLREIQSDPRVRVISYDHPFNYSKINNVAVQYAKGSILAFVNNDIEVISRDWLREMVSHAVRPGVGAVGARLYYPDDSVQHAGVLLGYKGRAGHMYRYAPRHWLGYWARAVLIQSMTAVTAACMVVRREVFEGVGGFDEDNFSVTFNDVDLCLRIWEQGFRNIYTPYAELYHHESKTRGLLAFQSEEDYFSQKWRDVLSNDPAYNPNLSLEREDFALAFPTRAVRPWRMTGVPGIGAERPLVSVVVRTHGARQEFLREALDSIFSQTYRPIQVIVVEDGGDNAKDVIAALQVPQGIVVDYHPLPKRGRCYAGNKGLEAAHGVLFGFLDDDDRFLPNHIESLVRCLNENPAAVGAYSASYEVPTAVRSLSPLEYAEGERRVIGNVAFSLRGLWNYNYIAIQSFLLRRELFERHGGFCEDLDCLEDWDMWLRYSAEGDFAYVDSVTSEFRMPWDDSVLAQRREQHGEYLPTLRRRQRELLDRYAGSPYYARLRQAYEVVGA